MQVFEREDGTVDGYCFACDTYVRNPYGEERKSEDMPRKKFGLSPEETESRLAEISSLGTMDLKDRRLRKVALEYYGIKIGLSEEDGETIAFHHYPYYKDGELSSYKTRLVENKKMWSTGDQRDVDLFGWQQAIETGARRLIIVEGELDAPSLLTILKRYQKEEFKELIPAVCSLPHGAASAGKDLARLAGKIRRYFKDISFAFDNDKAGQLAVEEACKVFPEATVINLPDKDANACLVNGSGKAAHKACIFNAQRPKNTRLVWGTDVHEDAKKPAEWGLSLPWEGLNKIMRGLRFGETSYWAAGEKMG